MKKWSDRKFEVVAFVVTLVGLVGAVGATLSNNAVFPQKPKLMVAQIPTQGKTPTYGQLGPTPGADGTKLVACWAINTDATNAYVVQMWLLRSAVYYLLGSVNVPLSSGNTSSAPAVNLFTASNMSGVLATEDNGNPYLFLLSGDQLQFAVNATTFPVGTPLTISCEGADF